MNGEQIMNKIIHDLSDLTAAELVIVLLTPLATMTLSVAFFWG